MRIIRQFVWLLFCGLTVLAVGCDRSPSRFTRSVAEICPRGWQVSASSNGITLRRETAVWIMGKVSNPPRRPDESIGDYFKRAGGEVHYELRLRFVSLLPQPAYEALKTARQQAAARFDKGASGKSEYTQWQIDYQRCQVPRFFTSDYSIFVDRWADTGTSSGYRIEPRFIHVYPPEAASEIEAVISSLNKEFNEYVNGGT